MDRHRFDADPNPYSTFHFDADADPDPDSTRSLRENPNFFHSNASSQYSYPSLLCHTVSVTVLSILENILKFCGKSTVDHCLSSHLLEMDTDPDADQQALVANPDPNPAR